MNAEVVLQVFLPYHSSPNFARMLAILTIPQTSPYHAPFAPLVKKAQPVPRSYISGVIAPEREKSLRLLGDVAGMITVAIREGTVHRPLVAFWTGVMVELLEKSKSGRGVSESLVKVLVETFVELLETKGTGADVNVSARSACRWNVLKGVERPGRRIPSPDPAHQKRSTSRRAVPSGPVIAHHPRHRSRCFSEDPHAARPLER
jgi:hypothetical protein